MVIRTPAGYPLSMVSLISSHHLLHVFRPVSSTLALLQAALVCGVVVVTAAAAALFVFGATVIVLELAEEVGRRMRVASMFRPLELSVWLVGFEQEDSESSRRASATHGTHFSAGCVLADFLGRHAAVQFCVVALHPSFPSFSSFHHVDNFAFFLVPVLAVTRARDCGHSAISCAQFAPSLCALCWRRFGIGFNGEHRRLDRSVLASCLFLSFAVSFLQVAMKTDWRAHFVFDSTSTPSVSVR